jgi:hypothetical protein
LRSEKYIITRAQRTENIYKFPKRQPEEMENIENMVYMINYYKENKDNFDEGEQ